jgi:hypothetical protein
MWGMRNFGTGDAATVDSRYATRPADRYFRRAIRVVQDQWWRGHRYLAFNRRTLRAAGHRVGFLNDW